MTVHRPLNLVSELGFELDAKNWFGLEDGEALEPGQEPTAETEQEHNITITRLLGALG